MSKKVELINKSKNYLENLTKKGIDINLSAFAYLCSFGVCPGYLKLKKFSKKSNFLYDLLIIISEILKISNLNNYSIINSSKHKNNSERLIISWARKEDFCEDGSYNDRYFKINSKDLNKSIWLVLYLDEIEPVFEHFPGWNTSTEGIVNFSDLTENAKKYIILISSLLKTPINLISTGPKRNQIISM